MATRIAAPKNDTSKPADHMTVINGAFSSNDLLAISKRPQHAPQRVRLINATDTAVTDVIVLLEDDAANLTAIDVPSQGYVDIDTPVKTLISGGATLQAHCYWWTGFNNAYNA